MSNSLEDDADDLLKAGKKVADDMSSLPALYSIAISLKRIADKLELSQKQPIMMTAEDFAEYKKSYDTHPGLGVKVDGRDL